MAVKVMVAPAIAKRVVEDEVRVAKRAPAAAKPRRRRSAVYDADGNEVFLTLMCLKCHKMRPLSLFGLRRMSDGSIRNQPWCRTCRSGASAGKGREEAPAAGESPVGVDSPGEAPSPAEEPGVRRRNVAAEVAAALAAGRG